MELIESGLAGMDLSICGESSAKALSRKKNSRKPRPHSLLQRYTDTRTRIANTDTRPPQIQKTEEQRREVEEKAPPTVEVDPEDDDSAPVTEEQEVEDYRKYWEKCFGRRHGSYDEETSLGSMCCATETIPPGALAERSLQFFSIEVTDLKDGLTWPLPVYGFVAARDSVDRKRNYLFRCSRHSCQTLTEKDPCLRLTGPSRAVMMIDPVAIEIQLKLKQGEKESEDEVLALDCFDFRESYPLKDGIRACIPRRRCTLEFALAVLGMSVDTSVGVRVVGGSWPDQCAGLIVCSTVEDGRTDFFRKGKVAPAASASEGRMVLLDFPDGKLPTESESDGTVELSRRIVLVPCPVGKLIVSVEASGDGFYARDTVDFGVKLSGASSCTCDLIFCKMEVTVTWSLVSVYREECCYFGGVQTYSMLV